MPFRLGGNNAKDESATGVLFNSFVEGNYILQLNGSRVIRGGGNAAGDFVQGERSFFPSQGSHLRAKAAMKDIAEGFNGSASLGTFPAGASRFEEKGNPGWKIGPGFKKVK